jgi:hypothetical protein
MAKRKNRAAAQKIKETPTRRSRRKHRGSAHPGSKRDSTQRQELMPAVETVVIDVVETRVTLPDPDAPASRDVPEPDSLGG